MRYSLPKRQLIGVTGKMPDLIWISELGGPDPRICHPDLLRLGPRKLSLICRYGMNRHNFKEVDKFLMRAVIKTCYSSPNSALVGMGDIKNPRWERDRVPHFPKGQAGKRQIGQS
jgi:hypothetical protein